MIIPWLSHDYPMIIPWCWPLHWFSERHFPRRHKELFAQHVTQWRRRQIDSPSPEVLRPKILGKMIENHGRCWGKPWKIMKRTWNNWFISMLFWFIWMLFWFIWMLFWFISMLFCFISVLFHFISMSFRFISMLFWLIPMLFRFILMLFWFIFHGQKNTKQQPR